MSSDNDPARAHRERRPFRRNAATTTTVLALALFRALSAMPAIAVSASPATLAKTARPAVWVVGDSVTVYSEDQLRLKLENRTDGQIEIDAVSGRNVVLLDELVNDQLASSRQPRVMVLALGSNPDAAWTRADYRHVLEVIPVSIKVVLVTVFRSRASVSATIRRQMADYSRAMRQLAASRDNVCVADWRGKVRHHVAKWTLDGVHPNSRGAVVWASLVSRAVSRCTAR